MKMTLIIIVSIAGAIVLALGIIALVGSLLPKAHTATRSIVLHKPPEAVYQVARDFASAPKWRGDVRDVQVESDQNGRVRFREQGKHGAVNYELVEDVPGHRMVTQITDIDLGYAGKWTYVFEPADSGTRLTITEDGEVSNVFFRLLSRYAFGHTATIDGYLTFLGKHFGEAVTPQ
jgi:uncharacterized protein YndB with AHSA1/START domain